MSVLRSAVEGPGVGPKKRGGRNKLFLLISGGVLLVALAVSAVLLLSSGTGEDSAQRVVEFGTVMQGVKVGGIDISGMTRDEALAATATLSDKLLGDVNINIDVNGELMPFTAQDFALFTDYETVIEQAIAYGRTGSFDERLKAANDAKEKGVDLPVTVHYDETALRTALTTLKSQLDTPPIDASATFAPWGFSKTENEDGTVTYTPYTPELDDIIDYCTVISKGKEYTKFPEFVRLSDAEMPSPLRYQYWNDRKGSKGGYEDEAVQRDANVARFIYNEQVDGLVVDIDAIYDAVTAQVESGSYETIVAPVEVTPATVTIEQVKNQTQMIASWTSSYGGSGHAKDYDRNYNVDMIASLLNGTVVMPGGTMSVNDIVGSRDVNTAKKYGWRKAAGIENGAYTPQYGGGVCQLGSTTYNAAIRSGLYVVESHHHSIPSGYVPIGLDATLNSGSLDLKLRNDATTPVYLVTYNNPTARTVTVEFYGVPLTDATGQQIIKKYTSKNLGTYGTPVPKTIIKPLNFVCPDGTILSVENTPYEHAKNRQGTIAQATEIIYSLDGTEISRDVWPEYRYPVINGVIYALDPASLETSTPSPSVSTSPSTPPAESPSASASSGTG